MKQLIMILIAITIGINTKAQLPYFPPLTGNVWDTTSPQSLNWCQDKIDSLYNYLDANHTKAFIVLKDGKIVLEKYFGTFTKDSLHYWASAGKSFTAFLIGLAQQHGFLSITDTTSDYLDLGWTSCTPAQEEKITIWHQLTMTTGLDDAVSDPDCTLDTCLKYKAPPGTRWAYHSAPYNLLHDVMDSASGMTLNAFTTQYLKTPIGMNGLFVLYGYHDLFVSTARSAARFGLLMLNKGNWNGNQIMTDSAYFNQMINSSQNLNKSYGYLWWLNGKSNFMIPTLQTVFPGPIIPDAPTDMYAAMGKNGQFIDIVPSQGIVLVRMGDNPGSVLVPYMMNDSIWQYMNNLECNNTSINHFNLEESPVAIYPNPAKDIITIESESSIISKVEIINLLGQKAKFLNINKKKAKLRISDLPKGFYFIKIYNASSCFIKKKFIKE